MVFTSSGVDFKKISVIFSQAIFSPTGADALIRLHSACNRTTVLRPNFAELYGHLKAGKSYDYFLTVH